MQDATTDSAEPDTDPAEGEANVATLLTEVRDELRTIGTALKLGADLHAVNSTDLHRLAAAAQPPPLP